MYRRHALGLAAFSFTLLFSGIFSPFASHTPGKLPAFDVPEDKLLFLRPLSPLTEPDIAKLARDLEQRLGVGVVLMPPLAAPPTAIDPSHEMLSAQKTLNWMFSTRPRDAWRYLAVTQMPLETGDEHALYGFASPFDRVAVISTFHFQSRLNSSDAYTQAKALDQLGRVALHEMAHTVGLKHCHNAGCLMHGVIPLDRLNTSTSLCHQCVVALSSRLSPPELPHEREVDLGDSFFARGLFEHALAAFERAQSYPSLQQSTPRARAELENRIGATLMSMTLVANGQRHLERAIAIDPALFKAHYNLAIVHAYAGLPELAMDALARGAELDPDPLSRLSFAGRFHFKVMDDPDTALRALSQYHMAGGDDPATLRLLSALEHPTQVLFDTEEVHVIYASTH